MPQVLSIALGHFDDFRSHVDLLTKSLLPSLAARFAYGERNLVGRPSLVARTSENLSRHTEQRRVVVDGRARVASDFRQRVAEESERLGGDFETKYVPLEVRLAPIVRQIPWPASGDHLFDLSNRPPARSFEPRFLGFGCRNPRELARRRPIDGSVA
jgi:hypothetical protein